MPLSNVEMRSQITPPPPVYISELCCKVVSVYLAPESVITKLVGKNQYHRSKLQTQDVESEK